MTTNHFWSEGLQQIFSRIAQAEGEFFGTSSCARFRDVRLHQKGNWLHIDGLISEIRKSGPGMARELVRRLAGRKPKASLRLPKKLATVKLRAKWITQKSNIIALYPEYGVAAKIARASQLRPKENIHNEFQSLLEIRAKCGDIVPEPISFFKDPVHSLWMKFYPKTEALKKAQEQQMLSYLHNLSLVYDSFGLRKGKICEVSEYEAIKACNIESLGFSAEQASLVASSLEKMKNTDCLFSKIHGDPFAGNMLLDTQGNILLSDWELSREGPIAFDVAQLIRRHPDQDFLTWYLKWIENADLNIDALYEINSMLLIISLYYLLHYKNSLYNNNNKINTKIEEHKKNILRVIKLL